MTTAREEGNGLRRRLAPLYPTVGASYLGYAMMATLFVPMLLTEGDGFLPVEDSYVRRTTVLGIVLALYPLGQFLGSPVLGALSDRYGRRPVLLASSAATVACYVGIASALTARSVLLLAPFLLLCGLVESNTALVMSAVADLTDDAQRPRYLGYVFGTTSVAYAVGPLLGGLLAEHLGYALPFWIVLGLLVVVLVWLWRAFDESLPPDARRATPVLGALSGLADVVTDRVLRRYYLSNLCVYVAAMGFWRVVTIYLVDEWGLSVGQVTSAYVFLAVTAGVANLVLLPRLTGRVGMRPLAVTCLLVGAVTVAATTAPAAFGLPASLPLAVAIASIASLVLALSFSALSALLSAAAPPDRQGRALGTNAALIVLGEVIGVSGGAFLAGIDSALPLLVLAAVLVVALLALGPARRAASPSGTAATERSS